MGDQGSLRWSQRSFACAYLCLLPPDRRCRLHTRNPGRLLQCSSRACTWCSSAPRCVCVRGRAQKSRGRHFGVTRTSCSCVSRQRPARGCLYCWQPSCKLPRVIFIDRVPGLLLWTRSCLQAPVVEFLVEHTATPGEFSHLVYLSRTRAAASNEGALCWALERGGGVRVWIAQTRIGFAVPSSVACFSA